MIELRVLGPISLKRADGTNIAPVLAQPKRLALAAYLAAPPPHGGRCFHRKDTLTGMFWPELDQAHARAALRNALYFLRTHLGAGAVLNGDEDAVGLDPNEVWCDLDAFDVAVRLRDYPTAFQLYRGPLLDGVFVADATPFEEWVYAQRMQRDSEAQECASHAARRHAAAGRVDEALVWARRARAMAPLNEDAARLVIALRHLGGDRAGALEESQRLEALLRSEYGVAPSGETQRLVQAVREGVTDAATVARAIAQVPIPPTLRASRPVAPPAQRAALHDRNVLEACVQTRLGLARRRGGKVGLIIVSAGSATTSATASATASTAASPGESPLETLGTSVLGGIRAADLVATVGPSTIAILPAEDAAVDVNALVGRLNRHLRRVAAVEGDQSAADTIRTDTIWLDPATGRPASELLEEARPRGHSAPAPPR